MSYLNQIDKERLPKHIAIIMDGNGRWAKQRGLDRTEGHKEGIHAVRRAIEGASKAGLRYMTLYTFSTENWNRPVVEIDALMSLMVQAIAEETHKLVENNIRLKIIGDVSRLPEKTKAALDMCLEKTSEATGATLILALSYSSKWEIIEAVKNIVSDIESHKINKADITERLMSCYLETKEIPDPEILVRTGGELRLSNFLMWQMAYSELYFTDELWPDFSEESLYKAVVDFQSRERRFGKTSEQISNDNNI